MDILSETYSLADLSAATEVNPQTLKAWLRIGYPVGSKIEGGGGRGLRRRFTFYTVMEIAVAHTISQTTYGTRDMEACFKAAQPFAFVGGGHAPVGFVDDGIQDDEPQHKPGLPFPAHIGDTYLFVAGANSFVELIEGETPPLSRIARNLGGAHSFIAVNLTALFFDVAARLGIEDPGAALDAAYAG